MLNLQMDVGSGVAMVSMMLNLQMDVESRDSMTTVMLYPQIDVRRSGLVDMFVLRVTFADI